MLSDEGVGRQVRTDAKRYATGMASYAPAERRDASCRSRNKLGGDRRAMFCLQFVQLIRTVIAKTVGKRQTRVSWIVSEINKRDVMYGWPRQHAG